MLKEIVCAAILVAAVTSFGNAQQEARSARIVERYRELLRENPTEGTALDRLWEMYKGRSETAELLGIYREDTSFSGRMLYGHLLRRAGMEEEAAKAFRQAASVDAQNPLPFLALADLESEAGDSAGAAAALEKACGLIGNDDPKRPGALMKLGNAWAAAGEPTRATEAWEQVAALDPGNVQIRNQLAQSYEQNDLPERAAKHYEAIVESGSAYERALAFRDLARVRQVLGDEDGAIAALERGIALTAPGNWLRESLQTQLIRLHQRLGRTDELERKWLKEVDRNPRDLGGYLQLVAFYRQLADVPQQREWLEKIVELSPRNLGYKEQLARVLVQLGDGSAASDLYDAVLAVRPDDVDAGFARAEIDIRMGAVAAAEQRVEKLLSAHPDDESVRAKALGFYTQNRLLETLERHLQAGATDADGIGVLAQFYFDRDRADDARAVLERLVDPAATPEVQAAAHQRIAGILRERNDLSHAIAEMESAAELQPGSSELALTLGNLYLGMSDLKNARKAVEKAYGLAEADGDADACDEADQALFQVFQAHLSKQSVNKEGRASTEVPLLDSKGRINLLAVPIPGVSARRQAENTVELTAFIEELARTADARKSPEAWLRVARWQIWARRNDLAMQAASEALEIDPNYVPARKMVVEIAGANGLSDVAVSQLKELVRLDPANKTRYRRQLAEILLNQGRRDEALDLFRELAAANPGDPDRLSDLAVALQRNGDPDGAIAAWREAYEVSTPAQRASVLPSLVHALDRKGRSPEALGLLLEAVDAQKEESLRFDAFQELLSHATAYDLVPVLCEEFEARHRRRPNDYFTEMALAQILKAQGHAGKSFDLQRAAAFSAPDPIEAFERLAAEAEALGRIDAAIEAQERLIALRSDDSVEALENLAEMQERALEIQAAAGTWRKTVARFPRNPEILRQAAEFFSLWRFDDDASEALRSARVLEPRDLEGLLRLADLALRSGREAEALSCYDQILRVAKPEEQEEIIVPNVPVAARPELQRAYFASLRSRKGAVDAETLRGMRDFRGGGSVELPTEGSYRLAAIRGTATILAGGKFEAQRQGWLREWDRKAGATVNDRLWAFYFAGDRDRTLRLLEERMDADPANPYTKQAFIWLALEMKGYEALGRWLGDSARLPQDRDLMSIGLGQYLAAHPGALDPSLARTVYPADLKLRQTTWQAAVLFANAGHFGEAVELGQRVFAEAVANRAAYGNELAYWYLILGDVENARRVLAESVRSRTGDAPDNPVFEALRRYVLLLSPGERDAFIEDYTSDSVHNVEPMHRAISRVLLFGLARDERRAADALRELYALHGLSYSEDNDGGATYRAWTFVRSMGIQLQRWHLDGLAGALWERALSDPALVRLAGSRVSELVRELEVRLVANDLVTRSPALGAVELADFLTEDGGEQAPMLASVLEASGYAEFSIFIYRQLCESDGSRLIHLRGLLNACRSANATSVATDTLIELMRNSPRNGSENGQTASKSAPNYRDTVLQFVDFLMGQEEFADAERLLAVADDFIPQDPMLLERQARVAMQRGDVAEAERSYRVLLEILPRNDQTRLLLAGVLDEQGKTAEAIAVLEEADKGPGLQNFDAPLADLYLKEGQIDRAREALGRLMRGNQHDAIPGLAQSLSEHGYRGEAQRLLYSIVQRARSEGDAYVWQTKFLEVLSPDEEPDLYDRALAQLRDMARNEPNHLPEYFETRLRLAQKHNTMRDLQEELRGLWSQGAGPYAAGAALAEMEIEDGESALLEETIVQLLSHPGFDSQVLERLRGRLAETGRVQLAAKIAGQLAERMPLRSDVALAYAQSLAAVGDSTAASAELEKLACRSVVEPALAGRVAEELHKLGKEDAAARAFKQAIQLDPFAVHYSAYVDYARFLIGKGDLDRAFRVLRYSFRNPANTEVEAIVDLLAADNRLRGADGEISGFQLSPSNLRRFQRAVTTRAAPDQTE